MCVSHTKLCHDWIHIEGLFRLGFLPGRLQSGADSQRAARSINIYTLSFVLQVHLYIRFTYSEDVKCKHGLDHAVEKQVLSGQWCRGNGAGEGAELSRCVLCRTESKETVSPFPRTKLKSSCGGEWGDGLGDTV